MNTSDKRWFGMGISLRMVAVGVLAVVAAGQLVFSLASAGEPDDLAASETAQQILQATGVRGGLIVHVPCGAGRLTAALRTGPGFLVHGLDRNAANIEAARQYIRSLGQYGPVTVAQWSGPALPYVENLVQLLVADLDALGRHAPAEAEMLRVLSPGGMAYI